MDKSILSAAWPPLTALVLAIVYLFASNRNGYQSAQASFNAVVIQRLDALEQENKELRMHVSALEEENLTLRAKVRELKARLEGR